jgi:hypothetical protein
VRSTGLEYDDLDRILLVGGSSRIPLVAEMVREATGRPIALDAHPKHTMALGAAYYGALQQRGAATPDPTPVAAHEIAASVSRATAPPGAASLADAGGSTTPSPSVTDRSTRSDRRPLVLAAAIGVVLIVVAGLGFGALGGSIGPTPSPEPSLSLTIEIAGTPHVIHDDRISYAELAALAFADQTPIPGAVVSFPYRRGPADDPRGTLTRGKSVKVRDGMRFDVGIGLVGPPVIQEPDDQSSRDRL